MEIEPLGPGTENLLASVVADGTATPDEARLLLVEFVRQVEVERVSPRMIEHLRDCVRAFLDGRKLLHPAYDAGRDSAVSVRIPTMDKAFGLKRVAAGGPRIDSDTLDEVAMEVLIRRLAGETLEEAAAWVEEDRKARKVPISSDSQIREAWARNQAGGFMLLRVSKIKGVETSPPWTQTEIDRLTTLFRGKLWFTPPGVDAMARMHAILAEVDSPDADTSDLDERLAAVVAKFDDIAPKKSKNKPA